MRPPTVRAVPSPRPLPMGERVGNFGDGMPAATPVVRGREPAAPSTWRRRGYGMRGPADPRRRGRADRLALLMERSVVRELNHRATTQGFRHPAALKKGARRSSLTCSTSFDATARLASWSGGSASASRGRAHCLTSELVVPAYRARLRHETESLILPGEARTCALPWPSGEPTASGSN